MSSMDEFWSFQVWEQFYSSENTFFLKWKQISLDPSYQIWEGKKKKNHLSNDAHVFCIMSHEPNARETSKKFLEYRLSAGTAVLFIFDYEIYVSNRFVRNPVT